MSNDDQLFALAHADDGSAPADALPADTPPSQIRNAQGVSLPLFCLYNGCAQALAAVLTRIEELTLHEIAALGRADQLEEVLQSSPWAVNTLSPDGRSALHLAAFFGKEPVVRRLLGACADAGLRARGFEPNLPLHAACAGGTNNQAAAIALIEATPDVDATQTGGWTAFMLAAANGMSEAVAALLAAGADASAVNDKGDKAAAIARARGHTSVAAAIDLSGAASRDRNVRGGRAPTPRRKRRPR